MTAATAGTAFLLPGCRGDILAQKTSATILDRLRSNAITDSGVSWCGARDVPDDVSASTNLSSPADKGERLFIYGKAFAADDSPAPNTLIYLYHTDIYGIYGRSGEHRHGRYRGWLLTDENGGYEFETIRPASYPNTTIAAHIHMTVTTASQREDWVDSILFEGDRFITPTERMIRKGGFDPVLKLTEDADGVFRGERNIRIAKG